MNVIFGSLGILAIGIVVLLLGGAAIAGIARSKKQGTSGSLSSAALEIQSLFEPEKKRAAETIQVEKEEEDDKDDRLQSPPR